MTSLRTAPLPLLLLTALLQPLSADQPTLARLSFWMPPERITEFEAAYEGQLVPLLQSHGLVPSTVQGRATVDSAFKAFAGEEPQADDMTCMVVRVEG